MKNVLVTGCSSGIGRATAELLRNAGWTVFPTARKTADLDALKKAGFVAIELDINSTESIDRAIEHLFQETDGTLQALVNNAGFGMPGAIEDLTRDAMRAQFETNLFGLQELTNKLIPTLRKNKSGRIVNVSSVVGRLSLPFMGIYSASKFALEGLSDALRIELSQDHIRVSLVEPGPIQTQFSTNCATQGEEQLPIEESRFKTAYKNYFKQRRNGGTSNDRFRLPPAAVAKKILHAIESPRPKIRYRVTVPAYLGDWVARFVPRVLLDRLMIRMVKKRFASTQK